MMGRLLLAIALAVLTMFATSQVVNAADAAQPKVIGKDCKAPEWSADENGHVVLRFLVAPDGSILQRDIAFTSGNADLDRQVLEALSQCRFAPNADQKEPRPMFISWPMAPTVKAPATKQDAKYCDRKPQWPPGAREAGERGTVILEFKIDEEGKVIDGKIMMSSGHADLDKIAFEALSKCHFKPSTQQDVPVTAWQQMKYTWNPSAD